MSGYPKVIGYLRVITRDQDLEKNKAAILSFANHRKLGPEWLEEKVSGVKSWRKREIAQVLRPPVGPTPITLFVSQSKTLGEARHHVKSTEVFSSQELRE